MGGEVQRVKAPDSAGCFAGGVQDVVNNQSPGCWPRLGGEWQGLSLFFVKSGCKHKEKGLGVPSLSNFKLRWERRD